MTGVIRLTAYDYTKCPPKVLAERSVFREPRRLVVRAAEGKKPAGEMWLSIQNEKGQPVAAALAVTALAGGKERSAAAGPLRARSAARIVRGKGPDSPPVLIRYNPSANCGCSTKRH